MAMRSIFDAGLPFILIESLPPPEIAISPVVGFMIKSAICKPANSCDEVDMDFFSSLVG